MEDNMENNTQTNSNEEAEKSNSSDSSKVVENQNEDQKIKRKKAIKKISIFLIILAVLGIIYGAYWLLYGRNYVKTDDAYVNGNQNSIFSYYIQKKSGDSCSISQNRAFIYTKGNFIHNLLIPRLNLYFSMGKFPKQRLCL